MNDGISDPKWQHRLPTVQGWYWVRWLDSRGVTLWFFDESDWDVHELSKADRFYGPLRSPELPPDD